MLDHGGLASAAKVPRSRGGSSGCSGKAAHMRLVDDGVVPGHIGGRSSPQLKQLSTTTPFGMARALSRRSKVRSPRGDCDAIAEQRVRPDQFAVQFARVRIEQQLVGIEAMAGARLVRAVGAIAVQQPGSASGR